MAPLTGTARGAQRLMALLILALLADDPALASKIKNNAFREASSTFIIHTNHLDKPSVFTTMEHWYSSMLAAHSPRATANRGRIVYTYDTVMHGFAVQLTGEEAQRMSDAPGVLAVHEDRPVHLLTTRSPGFLGLDSEFGAWRDTDMGDGVIIGFIDTGIWPESRSFNDKGLGPVRSSWRGKCVNAANFNSTLCNNKLVGAKWFHPQSRGAVPSPRDDDGHGTLMASTAAGSEVSDAGVLGFARGTARGMAPKARIAVYKVFTDGPTAADIVAAIEEAVKEASTSCQFRSGTRPRHSTLTASPSPHLARSASSSREETVGPRLPRSRTWHRGVSL